MYALRRPKGQRARWRHDSSNVPQRSALRFALPDATMPACCAGAAGTGPGFATPLDAFRSGERETLAYVPVTTHHHTRPGYLATIDLTTSEVRAHSK